LRKSRNGMRSASCSQNRANHGASKRNMEKTYIIAWKCRSHAAFGRSKTLFTREEAEQLAEELNRDYPNFIHEPLNLQATQSDPAESEKSTDVPAIHRDSSFTSAPMGDLPVPEAAAA